jgi:hypothetical protein
MRTGSTESPYSGVPLDQEVEMRRLVVAIVAGAVLALGVAAPASAQCPAVPAGEPGRSEFAKQHIVELAHAGVLGQGHKPGTHRGASDCADLND